LHKSRPMKHVWIILALLFIVTQAAAQEKKTVYDSLTDRTLSKQDMQEDLQYLRHIMEKTHPGLYRYTAKADMDRRLDSFYNLLNGPLPYYDYYKLLSSLIAAVRCAHTTILPGGNWQAHVSANAPVLPFSTHFISDRLYVTLNLTTDTTIKPGYEITHINAQPVADIKQFIFDHSWSDGYNNTNKQQRLNSGVFGFFYYFLIARPDSFAITAKDLSGKEVRVIYPALTMQKGGQQFRQNPVNKEIVRLYVDRKRDDLDLEIKKELSAAVLTIRSFGGKAADNIGTFLQKSMNELNKKKVGHLVVDLRYNGGGWDSAGVLLFTYLINQPSRYYIRQHGITDSMQYLKLSDLSEADLKNVQNEVIRETDGTFSLKPAAAAGLSVQNPKPLHYTGKVYFLMNGSSASTTSEFLAAARTYDLGVFIGEEAGGNYEGGNGGSFIPLQLPHSNIRISIPLVYYNNVTKPPVEKGRGVLPDHAVPDDMNNILKGIDTQKEFAFDLIKRAR
jgi:C-terminal processing protease CtpA/Prc